MYFQGFQTIDYVHGSVPEGDYRDFCQSCFLTGLQEPVVLRRTFWAQTKNRHSKWEAKLTKSLFSATMVGLKWHINYSYACSNWCVRVIYASFDPPLEIVSVEDIYKYLYPNDPSDENFFWVYTNMYISSYWLMCIRCRCSVTLSRTHFARFCFSQKSRIWLE